MNCVLLSTRSCLASTIELPSSSSIRLYPVNCEPRWPPCPLLRFFSSSIWVRQRVNRCTQLVSAELTMAPHTTTPRVFPGVFFLN